MLESKCVLLSPPAQLKGLKREKIKGGERSGKILLTASSFDKQEVGIVAGADGPSA